MPPDVMFVCTENSARSQMAEAFFRRLAPAGSAVSSAGVAPAQQLNPVAVMVMAEAGVDMNDQRPKSLSDCPPGDDTIIVSMGCMDAASCPSGSNGVLEWNIPDPKGRTADEVRAIRDTIESEVRALVGSLGGG